MQITSEILFKLNNFLTSYVKEVQFFWRHRLSSHFCCYWNCI